MYPKNEQWKKMFHFIWKVIIQSCVVHTQGAWKTTVGRFDCNDTEKRRNTQTVCSIFLVELHSQKISILLSVPLLRTRRTANKLLPDHSQDGACRCGHASLWSKQARVSIMLMPGAYLYIDKKREKKKETTERKRERERERLDNPSTVVIQRRRLMANVGDVPCRM